MKFIEELKSLKCKSFSEKSMWLRKYVDGQFDTIPEKIIFVLIIINTISIGLETLPDFADKYKFELFIID